MKNEESYGINLKEGRVIACALDKRITLVLKERIILFQDNLRKKIPGCTKNLTIKYERRHKMFYIILQSYYEKNYSTSSIYLQMHPVNTWFNTSQDTQLITGIVEKSSTLAAQS